MKKQMEKEIREALKNIMEKYELDVTITIQGTKANLNLKEKPVAAEERNSEKEAFATHCRHFGFSEEHYGREFTSNGQRFRFIGFNLRGRKNVCLAKRISDNENYIFNAQYMKEVLGLINKEEKREQDMEIFNAYAPLFGFSASDYQKVFTGKDQKKYRLIGINPNARKNVCKIEDVSSMKKYNCQIAFLQR